MADNVVPIRPWCYCVPWVDVEGHERKTSVRGCQDPEQARRSILAHHYDEIDGFVGEPTKVIER